MLFLLFVINLCFLELLELKGRGFGPEGCYIVSGSARPFIWYFLYRATRLTAYRSLILFGNGATILPIRITTYINDPAVVHTTAGEAVHAGSDPLPNCSSQQPVVRRT